MPQLDIFIFFSQYFIFILMFLVFYIFLIKNLIKKIDYKTQMGKYKMVYLYNIAATFKMIIDKNNKKTKNFVVTGIQMKNNLNKKVVLELILQKSYYKKFSIMFLIGLKKTKNNLKFNNYIKK